MAGIRYWESFADDHPIETADVRLEDSIGWTGDALALHNGEQIHVFGGIPGEKVRVEIHRLPRKYHFASVIEVFAPSDSRIAPVCPYCGQCTGCQWQHIDYQYQLDIKHKLVMDALKEVKGFDDIHVQPFVPSTQVFGYRNHARFTVRKDGVLGFVNRHTRHFIRIDKCLLMCPGINRILDQLQGHCSETTQLSIRHGVNTDEWLIQPAMKAQDISVESGQKYYMESLGGHRFQISSPSFFQVNTLQAEQMAELVGERLSLKGNELVVDAYAGVGTFAVMISRYAGKVIAIEESAAANKDARKNIEGLKNIELVEAKTELVLGALPKRPDVLILDPPRVGCMPGALDAVIAHRPKRIVYVSCDPHALARDLNILCSGPFRLDEILPVDLFPQTSHIECVATLICS